MPEENKKQRGTTVWIDPETLLKLEDYCNKYGVTKKDFVKFAVEWFERNEVDITSDSAYANWKQSYEQIKTDQKQLPSLKEQIDHLMSNVEVLPTLVKQIQELPQKLSYLLQQNPGNFMTKDVIEEHITTLDQAISKSQHNKVCRSVEQILRLQALLSEALRELERCRGLFSRPNEKVIEEIHKMLNSLSESRE